MSPEFIPLREEDVDPDPLRQFAAWFDEAGGAGVRMPEAVALATATPDGAPSVRMVLMKGFDERGFVFFTNYESRKGARAGRQPARRAAVPLGPARPPGADRGAGGAHQRRGVGRVHPLRPRGQPAQRAGLAAEPAGRRAGSSSRRAWPSWSAADGELPLRRDWGGYRLAPESFEFWQHRDDRLHDRLVYRPARAAAGRWSGWRPNRPRTARPCAPSASMSTFSAAGLLPSPGICMMSPHSGTSQPAPV